MDAAEQPSEDHHLRVEDVDEAGQAEAQPAPDGVERLEHVGRARGGLAAGRPRPPRARHPGDGRRGAAARPRRSRSPSSRPIRSGTCGPSGLTGMCPTSPANPRGAGELLCRRRSGRRRRRPRRRGRARAGRRRRRRGAVRPARRGRPRWPRRSAATSPARRPGDRASGTSRQPRFGAIVTTPASRRTMPTIADADADHALGVGQPALHGAREGRRGRRWSRRPRSGRGGGPGARRR